MQQDTVTRQKALLKQRLSTLPPCPEGRFDDPGIVIAAGVAVLIGSLSFLIMVVCCLPGGIVYFFYKPSGVVKRAKLSEMQREVATAEHEIPEPQ